MYMKKIIFFIALFLPFSVFAGSEERECFNLLNEAIENDTRFQDSRIFVNGDLSQVLYDEANNSYYDFSSYQNFRSIRARNPIDGSRYFLARRNNIGTIISPSSNYVVSQITGFWRDSNFDFPLTPRSGPSLGDPYKLKDGFFKEYVLYTHHVNSHPYDLMSCGIVKVVPLDGRTFSEISESGYMTNIITGASRQTALWNRKCSSGFEGEYQSSGWEDFYKMKANVCVQAYDESDYLKMEVISIAFDNESEILNEYETHPIQVKAMKDHKNHANGLKGIQDEFRNDLYNDTCFYAVHGSRLPWRCRHSSFLDNLQDLLIPQSYARLNDEEELLEAEDTFTWSINIEEMWAMQAYESIPYPLYKKLESIPDEKFRSYMLLSILPNFDTVLEHRQATESVLLSPYEEVFLACDMSYERRLENVLDFLEKLDVENFSLWSLDYLDEAYGNCIIPYPDKDVLGTVVEGSFESNILLAEKLSGLHDEGDIPEDVQAYIAERQKLLDEYNAGLEELESQYNKWEISASDFNSMFEENENALNDRINALNEESKEVVETSIKQEVDKVDSDDAIKNPKMTYLKILSIILLLSIGAILVYFALTAKKNHNK